MAYEPDKAKEVEPKAPLPPDTVLTGTVIQINDGKAGDFLHEKGKAKWTDLKQPTINVTVEVVKHPDEEPVRFDEMFPYRQGNDGSTEYTKLSSIGKYKEKYGHLPKHGDVVKVTTNGKGYGEIKTD